jgi:sulfate transport system permease protein
LAARPGSGSGDDPGSATGQAIDDPRARRIRRSSGPTRYLMRYGVLVYLALLVGLPVIMVGWQTLRGGLGPVLTSLSDPALIFAFQLTVQSAVAAVVINTIFGVGVSLLLVRYRFPGRRLLSALVDLPLSVSPVVVGLALLLVYDSRTGWFASIVSALGIPIVYAPVGIILATAFVSLPLVIREVVPVLQEAGFDAEQAATSLGASGWQTFWRITLPTIRWGLIYGIVLSLARSLGEYGAVNVVSGNVAMRTQTATLFVQESYNQFGAQSTTDAYTAALILALVAVVALIVVAVLQPRSASSGGVRR